MMKSFRNLAFAGLMTLGAFSAMTFTSCNSDKCKDVVCQNNGTCDDGTCVCGPGYEGDLCQTESRSKFVKTWSASDQIGSNTIPYTVNIVNGASVTNVLISNEFSDDFFDNTITATVSGNTIEIPDQRPDANGGYRVKGTGVYNSGRITWTYTLTRILDGAEQNYTGLWQ